MLVYSLFMYVRFTIRFNMAKLCILLFLVTVSAVIAANDNRTAVVHLKTATVEGNVTFQQIGNGHVRITGLITGLENGKHGFHIHERGDIVPCEAAGGHYNPLMKNHGSPTAAERHVGDLGNIESSDGKAMIDFEDNVISLIGEYSIVGRSLVIHANEDDLGNTTHPQSKTTGNAGGRVACGVIGIK
ncbi:Superoxide dismutase [Cu-Zn] [Gryllus bimaculatus]|nr:Superoxide dismutase [Cu-Zn] [Gryllus bimaculatus]